MNFYFRSQSKRYYISILFRKTIEFKNLKSIKNKLVLILFPIRKSMISTIFTSRYFMSMYNLVHLVNFRMALFNFILRTAVLTGVQRFQTIHCTFSKIYHSQMLGHGHGIGMEWQKGLHVKIENGLRDDESGCFVCSFATIAMPSPRCLAACYPHEKGWRVVQDERTDGSARGGSQLRRLR